MWWHLADHVVVMNLGRIEKSGPAAVVLHQPQADFTRLLLATLPPDRHGRCLPAEGGVADSAVRVVDSQRPA